MRPDRRKFLARSSATFATLLTPKGLPVAMGKSAVPAPPVARIEIARDTYFGETLSDPYRWMENDKDAEWLPFLRGQNDHTRAVLDALPFRESLLKRIRQLSADTVLTSHIQRAGGLMFFQQRPLGADNYKLFVRQNGRDRLLVDPTALSDH